MKKPILIILIILLGLIYTFYNNKVYDANDFGIDVIKSNVDFNKNSIDDYTDILNGAKIEAKSKVKYKSGYYDGGYPPENEGVCTDLIWRAFKHAGYELKDLVDEDIKNNKENYINADDSNIDFRRVENLNIFFKNNAINLTLDINDISSFQPGDIVSFGDKHIAIISDKRNKKGIPYLIHNAGQYRREDNTFLKWNKKYGIKGHFRWNSSNDINDIKKFKDEYEQLNSSVYMNINLDNKIIYKNETEIIDILTNKTGVIYFGFPSCPWCRNAVPVLLDVLKEYDISLYYLNTRNSDTKEIVKILAPYLLEVNGVKSLYVPDVYFVKDGNIMGHHLSTVDSQKNYNIPLDEKQTKELKNIYRKLVEKIGS